MADNAPAYRAGMSALGHAMLGAAFASAFGLWGLAPALAIAAAYWWVKERSDLRRGGSWLDGAEDALMVCLGVWYGPAWWPAAMLACCRNDCGGIWAEAGHQNDANDPDNPN